MDVRLVFQHVIRQQQIGTAMAHQLYVMQIFLMNLHEQRMKTPIDSHDQVIFVSVFLCFVSTLCVLCTFLCLPYGGRDIGACYYPDM